MFRADSFDSWWAELPNFPCYPCIPWSPYMEEVFPIREGKRSIIPAVTHVDGSGRLQSVSKRTNPKYHALISKFFEKIEVPSVLNTSLNENEPVVRIPKEAISCFLRTDMDVLVLGNHLLDRHSPDFPEHLRKRVDLKPGELPGEKRLVD